MSSVNILTNSARDTFSPALSTTPFTNIFNFYHSDGQKWMHWCGFNLIIRMIFGMFICHLYWLFLHWFFIPLIHFSINSMKLWAYTDAICMVDMLQIFFPSHHISVYGVYHHTKSIFFYGFWDCVMIGKVSATL